MGFRGLIKFGGRINSGIACHCSCWESVASCGNSSGDEGGCDLAGIALGFVCFIILGVGVVCVFGYWVVV